MSQSQSTATLVTCAVDPAKVAVPVPVPPECGAEVLTELADSVMGGECATTSLLIDYGSLCQRFIDARLAVCEGVLKGKEYSRSITMIEHKLTPLIARKPEVHQWLRYAALASAYPAVAKLPQTALKPIVSLLEGTVDENHGKAFVIAANWTEYASGVIAKAAAGEMNGQGVREAIEDEETRRIAALSSKEAKAHAQAVKAKERKQAERMVEKAAVAAKKAGIAVPSGDSEAVPASIATDKQAAAELGNATWSTDAMLAFWGGLERNPANIPALLALTNCAGLWVTAAKAAQQARKAA